MSVEIEDAGTVLDNANMPDHTRTNSNLQSFINTGNFSNMQQKIKARPDTTTESANMKNKPMQMGKQQTQQQYQDQRRRPTKPSRSQTNKMRTKQNINYNQQAKGNLQTSGKLISSQTKHATRPLLRENELESGMDGLEDSKRFHNQTNNIKANIVTNIVDGAM